MIRLAMNRAVRTTVPVLVTSVTSTTPRDGADLDPPPGPGGTDLIGLRPVPGIDHDLDAVPLHGTLQERKNIPDIPLRAPLKLQAHSPSSRPANTLSRKPAQPPPSRRASVLTVGPQARIY